MVPVRGHGPSLQALWHAGIGILERAGRRNPLPSAFRALMQAGLCDSCKHQKLVHTTRGSVFSMCERSKTDPSYPKYPRLPVKECPGYVNASR